MDADTHVLGFVLQWRANHLASTQEHGLQILDPHTAFAVLLCLLAASMSSAGGVGGGALFLPILNLVAGLDLKTATTFSAFMVTGGSISNVLYNMSLKKDDYIDYDIALLSEPCMLLGVTLGVICNVVFPEWLVTLLFVMLLAFSTFKTCMSGTRCWKVESDMARREMGAHGVKEEKISVQEPLLGYVGEEKVRILPWKKVASLLSVWLSFFAVQSLRGAKNGMGPIWIEQCSVGYWTVSSLQIPLALLFTARFIYSKHKEEERILSLDVDTKTVAMEKVQMAKTPKILFPVAAFLAGLLGGLFAIGGGLLMNPFLLHIGVRPQIAAATSSFMVLFSSSMSSFQYLMIGMKNTGDAAALSAGCFVASLVGLVVVQRAVRRYGRASIIIFTVSTVMALSTVSMTCFGALDVWREYINGDYMGFKPPC